MLLSGSDALWVIWVKRVREQYVEKRKQVYHTTYDNKLSLLWASD